MTTPKLTAEDQETVWQAEGVLAELLGCELVEAAFRLRWRARSDERSVVETATSILSAGVLGQSVERDREMLEHQ